MTVFRLSYQRTAGNRGEPMDQRLPRMAVQPTLRLWAADAMAAAPCPNCFALMDGPVGRQFVDSLRQEVCEL
jgi:hypothetical protein